MAALTQGSLQIQSAVPMMDIQRFEMKMQANAHASFYDEGIVSDEDGEESVWQPQVYFQTDSGGYRAKLCHSKG